jgi:hypothetical protein
LHLASVELPAVVDPTGKNLLTEIEHFHRVAQEHLPLLVHMISDATDTIENDEGFMENKEQWQKHLDIAYPEEKTGRITVNFHLFAASLSLYSGIKTAKGLQTDAPKIVATFGI